MQCTNCEGTPTKGLCGLPVVSDGNELRVVGVEPPSLCADCLWDSLVSNYGGFCNDCLRQIEKAAEDGSFPATIKHCSERACLNGPPL